MFIETIPIASDEEKTFSDFGSIEFQETEMSEVKNEKPIVGNLRNRVDVNLKLEIPKPEALTGQIHAATAPANPTIKDQFGDQILKDLMNNWDHDNLNMSHDDYFKKIPSSAASAGFKRENPKFEVRRGFDETSFAEPSVMFTQLLEESGAESSPEVFANLSPILQFHGVSMKMN